MRRFTTCDFFTLLVFCLAAFSSASLNAQSRWGRTATDGSGLGLGDATTVTWGYVADGTAISGHSADPSDLVEFLDDIFDVNGGGSDYTDRPWHDLFVDIFDRWDAVSGLSFDYESKDSGQAIDGSTPPVGVLGVVADVRIGGHSIDGQSSSNILAYNYFPDHGDMVIDTDNVSFYSQSGNNYRGLRNVLAHEFGHGMGLPHVSASNSRQLMEGVIELRFDGPQMDDIHQAQRRYGDDDEDGAGNDTFDLATELGTFSGTLLEIGVDADLETLTNSTYVSPSQVDFVSIDDDSDIDFLRIDLDGLYDMSFVLDMVGPTNSRNGSGYDLSEQSDLDLILFADDGTTILGQSNLDGLDVNEQIDLQLAAGTYLAQITGRNNAAQFYRFQAFGTSAVPEPGSLLALSLFGALLLRRKRS